MDTGFGLQETQPPAIELTATIPDVIELKNLSKSYGKVRALDGLDLTVKEGDVYGFLGRNGAGKSTAIRILMGITKPTKGIVNLFGKPLGKNHIELRQRIGYVAQEQNFYGWMTPVTIGNFVSGFYPTWDDVEYVRLLKGLDLPKDRKIRTFSGGMRANLHCVLHWPTGLQYYCWMSQPQGLTLSHAVNLLRWCAIRLKTRQVQYSSHHI
jgi:ABC-2 type transport system ATP-binding protein